MKSFKSFLALTMAMAVSSTVLAESSLPTTMLKDSAKQTLDAGKQAVENAQSSAQSMATDKMPAAKEMAKTQAADAKQAVMNQQDSAKAAVNEQMNAAKTKATQAQQAVKKSENLAKSTATDAMSQGKEKAATAKDQLKAGKEAMKKAGKVNINTADAKTLQSLSGIGEAKAQAIIDYRNKNGKIKNIKELSNVSGIGEATLEKLKGGISF